MPKAMSMSDQASSVPTACEPVIAAPRISSSCSASASSRCRVCSRCSAVNMLNPSPRKGADMQDVITCLWFDAEGEDAAKFYTSIFPDASLGEITRYGAAGPRAEGTAMTVAFELMGRKFVALNGGPQYSFNEAISFQVL